MFYRKCLLTRELKISQKMFFAVFVLLISLISSSSLTINTDINPTVNMFKSIQRCDIDEVLLSIYEGADVNYRLRSGKYPLHIAIIMKSTLSVRALLEGGAIVDSLDSKGRTPLMKATEKGLKDIVELLLSHNPDLSLTTEDGRKALDFSPNKRIKRMLENPSLSPVSIADQSILEANSEEAEFDITPNAQEQHQSKKQRLTPSMDYFLINDLKPEKKKKRNSLTKRPKFFFD